ncbi:LysR family transcriptional regulator ArgP [Desulfoluna spongiiphila]|uniref:LysR family transcriptional regulator ArgP n=1 Tax=Desulfoluna spongiiphila TaxID=419481 RepID=UPI001256ABB5|nr:LysR family transcriptional regulator ArgP [Desulfoluna spongiiphila]VVS92031.1 hth-type transcriptional regulator argp [Desulfoluna spongiiphila]
MHDYKLIEAMARVVLEGGFEKAARVLNISQSAVSQRVKLLEEQAGQVLLSRTAPPSPTRAGEIFLAHYFKVAHLETDLAGTLAPSADEGFHTLAVGVNADSLETWLLPGLAAFLREERLLLDFCVDDQDETLRFLKSGETVGCITSSPEPVQGCRVAYLGAMAYRMVASPAFAERWFPGGFGAESAARAPAVLFNRKDELHERFLRTWLTDPPGAFPRHFIPSSVSVVITIVQGMGYGLVPMQQASPLLATGALTDVAPGREILVPLYWHAWNVKSALLERFSRQLVEGARRTLLQPVPGESR